MLVGEFSTRPPWKCSIIFNPKEWEDQNLRNKIISAATYFRGQCHIEEDSRKCVFYFDNESDMFMFGRYAPDPQFDPDTFEPHWIVKTEGKGEFKTLNEQEAFFEYHRRQKKHPNTTEILSPTVPLAFDALGTLVPGDTRPSLG